MLVIPSKCVLAGIIAEAVRCVEAARIRIMVTQRSINRDTSKLSLEGLVSNTLLLFYKRTALLVVLVVRYDVACEDRESDRREIDILAHRGE
jgi:hypothetical protein